MCIKNRFEVKLLAQKNVMSKSRQQQGPFTRGRHRQSKPNTRSMRRLDIFKKLKRICSCCADTVSQVNRSGKSARKVAAPKRNFVNKFGSETHTNTNAPKKSSTKLSETVGKGKRGSYGKRRRCTATAGWGESAKGRGPVNRPFVGVEVSVPKPPQGRTAACSLSPELSNLRGNVNLFPFGFAHSSKSSVKLVLAYGCQPCCDCTNSEHTPKEQSTVCRHEKSLRKVENTPTKHNKRISWRGLNPQLTLCDIGPKLVECSHKCSFVLSTVIKSKIDCCFTEEMRAGFRFEPGCLGQKKHSINESVQVNNNQPCLRLQSEQGVQNKIQQNTELRNTDPGASLRECESNCPSACFFPPGELRPKELCINGTNNKYTDINQNLLRNEAHVNNPEAHCFPDLSHVDNNSPSLNDCVFNDTSVHCISDYSKTNVFVQGQVCAPDLGSGFSEVKSSELNGRALDDTDEPDSFTCQRVRAYSRKIRYSCARTYLKWPFSSSIRCSTEPAVNGDCAVLRDSSRSHQRSVINASSESTNPAHLSPQPISNYIVGDEEKSASEYPETCIGVPLSPSLPQSVIMLPEKPGRSCSSLATCASPRQDSKQTRLVSLSPIVDSARSTPSPSKLGLTTPNVFAVSLANPKRCLSSVPNSPCSFPTSSLLLHGSSVNGMELANADSLDSNYSCDSSLLLPQHVELSLDKTSSSGSPPKLEPCFKTRPIFHKLTTESENSLLYSGKCLDSDLLLPPLLSPLNSPQKHIVARSSDKYNQITQMHKCNLKISHQNQSTVQGFEENSVNYQQSPVHYKPSPSSNSDESKNKMAGTEEPEQHPLGSAASPASDVHTGSSASSRSSNESEESSGDEESSPFQMEDDSEAETPELDEIKAYEQDILLVDVTQEDPDLFEKVPQKSLLKLGPVRASETQEAGRKKMVKIVAPTLDSSKTTQSVVPVNIDFLRNSPSTTGDSPRRPWRPQCNSTSSLLQCNSIKQTRIVGQAEGRIVNVGEERTLQSPMAELSSNFPPQPLSARLGSRITNISSTTDIRWQKSSYCRQYFSESLTCGFKICRFHHVPLDGDEKFCIETVAQFTKIPACLHKAGAVFTGYYQSNAPGVHFSRPVLLSLLWALLKAGIMPDLFSVLRTSLLHKIVPEHEFLLGLFNFIREKGLMSFVPELMQIIFKMAGCGLPLSLDCLDCVKNTPELLQTVSSGSPAAVSGNRSTTLPEYLNLAHAVVEIELCTKQEDWKRLGEVFRSICQSSQHINQVERISGRIAVALLSDCKDKLTLPYAAFAETASRGIDDESPVKSFLGRIGVSLMLRYHKTHQWAKGQKVVEVLSASKISYATMKGLFGNEDRTSRCHLVTMATKLYLLNGSVEGALNTLRENEWFVTSSVWPCEPADMEKRTHVLLRLAEKSSHRDTLEILCNLPGLKEPNSHIDISRYSAFFSSHLQTCIDRQILPLASDMVDFMLSKRLSVDHAMLHLLLHRLGKQNHWLRAREVFRHSLNESYYPGVSAPFGFMALIVPSELGEIELALTFEMFITVNATAILSLPENTTSTMIITLKRTKSSESDYLAAGSRLLSASCIPQPKLSVRYTTVNSSQEQVFNLDISTARRWLRHNHLWASEIWTSSTFKM